ncbi:STAS domain-containing protein [Streptosporangiaceae bacterium NEAU-GS5]|nr:STAS domain-containing protein [Streptosporangiaceae bacterium NEAU-GS5]
MTRLHPRPGAGLWLIPAAATVVHLRGELDLATADPTRDRLLGMLQRCASLLIADLSGVSFCDATGLSVLVGVRRQANSRDVTLGLAAPHPQMTNLLRITGLGHSFPMYGTTPNRARAVSGIATP